MLLKAKAFVMAQNTDGFTALYAASFNGHLEMLKALLEAKIDVMAKCTNGFTALHMACLKGDAKTVNSLISAHADVMSSSNDGCTSLLIIACEPGHMELIKPLLSAHKSS